MKCIKTSWETFKFTFFPVITKKRLIVFLLIVLLFFFWKNAFAKDETMDYIEERLPEIAKKRCDNDKGIYKFWGHCIRIAQKIEIKNATTGVLVAELNKQWITYNLGNMDSGVYFWEKKNPDLFLFGFKGEGIKIWQLEGTQLKTRQTVGFNLIWYKKFDDKRVFYIEMAKYNEEYSGAIIRFWLLNVFNLTKVTVDYNLPTSEVREFLKRMNEAPIRTIEEKDMVLLPWKYSNYLVDFKKWNIDKEFPKSWYSERDEQGRGVQVDLSYDPPGCRVFFTDVWGNSEYLGNYSCKYTKKYFWEFLNIGKTIKKGSCYDKNKTLHQFIFSQEQGYKVITQEAGEYYWWRYSDIQKMSCSKGGEVKQQGSIDVWGFLWWWKVNGMNWKIHFLRNTEWEIYPVSIWLSQEWGLKYTTFEINKGALEDEIFIPEYEGNNNDFSDLKKQLLSYPLKLVDNIYINAKIKTPNNTAKCYFKDEEKTEKKGQIESQCKKSCWADGLEKCVSCFKKWVDYEGYKELKKLCRFWPKKDLEIKGGLYDWLGDDDMDMILPSIDFKGCVWEERAKIIKDAFELWDEEKGIFAFFWKLMKWTVTIWRVAFKNVQDIGTWLFDIVMTIIRPNTWWSEDKIRIQDFRNQTVEEIMQLSAKNWGLFRFAGVEIDIWKTVSEITCSTIKNKQKRDECLHGDENLKKSWDITKALALKMISNVAYWWDWLISFFLFVYLWFSIFKFNK